MPNRSCALVIGPAIAAVLTACGATSSPAGPTAVAFSGTLPSGSATPADTISPRTVTPDTTEGPTATPSRPSLQRNPTPSTAPLCTHGEVRQHLSTDRSRYQRGQTVRIDATITNVSGHPCFPVSSSTRCITFTRSGGTGDCSGLHALYPPDAVWGPGQTRSGDFPTWDQNVRAADGYQGPAPAGDYSITLTWGSYPPLTIVITLEGPPPTPVATPTPTPTVALPLP